MVALVVVKVTASGLPLREGEGLLPEMPIAIGMNLDLNPPQLDTIPPLTYRCYCATYFIFCLLSNSIFFQFGIL